MREIVEAGDEPEVVADTVVKAANAAFRREGVHTAGKRGGAGPLHAPLPAGVRSSTSGPPAIQPASRLTPIAGSRPSTPGPHVALKMKVSSHAGIPRSIATRRRRRSAARRNAGAGVAGERRHGRDPRASGVNVLDNKIQDGEFKPVLPYRLPLHPRATARPASWFGSGGSKVRRSGQATRSVHDRAAQDRIGTFAEFIAMDEADVAMKPKNLTMERRRSGATRSP